MMQEKTTKAFIELDHFYLVTALKEKLTVEDSLTNSVGAELN